MNLDLSSWRFEILFPTLPFVVFFIGVLLVHRLLRPGVPRKSFLLVVSYYFYACWDWRFLGLILASTVIDFVAGEKIFRADSKRAKRIWMWVSLSVNLGILGFFKYFNFFVDSCASLMSAAGFQVNPGTLEIVLPVGISFYTFQTLSYSIDIYRGRLEPSKSLLDFSLFVAFFPQLVAGPIVRASEFLPQLAETKTRRADDFFEGLERFLVGLFKKVMIADIAARIVDPIFADPQSFSGLVCAAGALSFTFQIYFDFSGYSDMAIGLAKMLGYKLPTNFRLPYLATSMTDFWRRWHISLSSWFRDYLYIPLGGNRGGKIMTGRNLVLTFLLTGLWHGANWTFIAFGAWNGALLLLERLRRKEPMSGVNRGLALRVLGLTYCWIAIVISFTIFRATSLGNLSEILTRVLDGADGRNLWFSPVRFYYVVGAAVLYHVMSSLSLRQRLAKFLDPWLWRPFFYAIVLLILLAYAPLDDRSFIYFAF